MVHALVVLNVTLRLCHRLVHMSAACFMLHKVHFIHRMTHLCEMIFASTFVAFPSPCWTLLLPRIMPCGTTTMALVTVSTKLLPRVMPCGTTTMALVTVSTKLIIISRNSTSPAYIYSAASAAIKRAFTCMMVNVVCEKGYNRWDTYHYSGR